ncbi:hypothetical protein bcgnr5378_07400 [Bacillus cereus]
MLNRINMFIRMFNDVANTPSKNIYSHKFRQIIINLLIDKHKVIMIKRV